MVVGASPPHPFSGSLRLLQNPAAALELSLTHLHLSPVPSFITPVIHLLFFLFNSLLASLFLLHLRGCAQPHLNAQQA